MAPRPRIPEHLRHRPFTRDEGMEAGLTSRMLNGASYRRLFPQVWVVGKHVMSDRDWLAAAAMAMPDRAHMSHLTRIRALGLDIGPLRPFHFTVAGDLHLDVDDAFVHRTEVLPPVDGVGVTPASAFIQHCATARMVDAIKVGDWLLHHGHMTVAEVAEVAQLHDWRPGAKQALRVLEHLHRDARSVKESETRAVLVFAGLPRPQVNMDIHDPRGELLGCGDLVLPSWKVLVEYEGRQHEGDIAQWNGDIDRYRGFRDAGWRYVQVTNEKLALPRKLVSEVYGLLVRGGYDGRPPVFGTRWRSLFAPMRAIPRRGRWSAHLSSSSKGA